MALSQTSFETRIARITAAGAQQMQHDARGQARWRLRRVQGAAFRIAVAVLVTGMLAKAGAIAAMGSEAYALRVARLPGPVMLQRPLAADPMSLWLAGRARAGMARVSP